MNLFSRIDDPTDLDRIRAVIAESERPESLTALGIRRLRISDDASSRVVDELTELLSAAGGEPCGVHGAHIVVLIDATLIRKGAADLKRSVIDALAASFTVTVLTLGYGGHLFADDAALDAATAALRDARAIVSVGSGTISDVAKVASTRCGHLPHVLVQTAASVDGYTDNVSVVLRAGAKRTIPSRWPDVVLADTEVIQSAPRELNTAGFGEVLSLFTAPADWWLALRTGTDASFHSTPRDLLLTFAGEPAEWGRGLSAGDPDAVAQLTRVLAIRGIGTGIAGSTACLSGMEHLISHMLDMYAAAHHHDLGLHGAQVGVASVVAASAWEHLLTGLRDGREMAPDPPDTSDTERRDRVLAVFVDCDASGALGAECWRDYSAKRVARAAAESATEIVSDVEAFVKGLGAMVPDRHRLAKALEVAGAPARRDDLGEWVDAEVWRWAVANSHFMRNRMTIVDLLAELGWWTDSDVDAVLCLAEDAVAKARA